MLLAIKNVMPDSLELFWSPATPLNSWSAPLLRLMVTCTSRGSGGCNLSWGVVLHCPAEGASTIDPERMRGRAEDEGGNQFVDQEEQEELVVGVAGTPELVCCDVTLTNVTLTFYKPQPRESTTSTVWWESVAVGRALGPGLQVILV